MSGNNLLLLCSFGNISLSAVILLSTLMDFSAIITVAAFYIYREFSNERCFHMTEEVCLLLAHSLVIVFSHNYEYRVR